MSMNKIGFAGVVALAMSATPTFAQRASDEVALSTPPGVTLVDVTTSQHKLVWRRLGDANGKPLYTYDKDGNSNTATCVAECAKEFLPLMAGRNAKAFDKWTLVPRPEGGRQWAYLGQPLYSYSGEDPVGDPPAGRDVVQDDAQRAIFDFGSKNYSPKDGWKRAAYMPEKTIAVPAGIELQSLAVANGYGFVLPSNGMVMYTLDGAPKNNLAWTPVYAPGAARETGDFSIIAREDGTQQWAYKNKPLFTFKGDYSPGDINGLVEDNQARVALAYRHFMPADIRIDVLALRGPLMVAGKKGLTLYTQSRQKLQYGGRQTRGGYRYSYSDAKAVGTAGCVDECLKSWIALKAPSNAQSQGFWEVATRPDGSKQWAYRGSPLYTFIDDKEAGDLEGNNRHTIVYGDTEGKVDLTLTGGNVADPKNMYGNYGSGFYWHTVGLFN